MINLSRKNRSQALLVAGIASISVVGCASSDPNPRALGQANDRRIIRETPSVLRGTIGAQTTVRGMDAMLVSGYGLVVGLNGTGSSDVPGPIRAILEREMTRLGVGREASALRGITPTEMLNDVNTAVVLVSAAIAPSSPKGSSFDVEVRALPGTATASLEDGLLYTTDLFPGLVRPASPSTTAIARARGDLFINPFADPGDSQAAILRTVARVLDGGTVIEPRLVTLELDSPSHSRARAIADAINARFPRERGGTPAAVGRNEETIELQIPQSFRDDPNEFIQILRHTRIDQSFPNEAAIRYSRALRDTPELAEPLTWCFQSLGQVAIPHLRTLYVYPEETPRQAAILAGAKLNDMVVRPHLEEMITTGPLGLKTRAVALLGDLGVDPKINLFLRDVLNDDDLSVRVAAYEALRARGDPWIRVRRMDDKFTVHTIPSVQPMVYVSMGGEPTIVLFGDVLEVHRPVFVAIWDGRLMLRADEQDREVGVLFRDHRSERVTTGRVSPDLIDLIDYLAHETTPEEPAPGLDMSYAQVVGALSQICDNGGVSALFVSEADRLALDLQRGRQTQMTLERPETAEDGALNGAEALDPRLRPEQPIAAEADTPTGLPEVDSASPETRPKRTYVVPLGPKPKRDDPADGEG